MKVYEIREVGGEFEDGYDNFHSAYLSEEKAKAVMSELKKQRDKNWAQAEKCEDCPIAWWFDTEEELEEEKKKYPDNGCIKKATFSKLCAVDYWDIPVGYYIKEIEVIE